MAANYGLLAGIDQGLKEAVGAYRDESRYQDEKAQRAKDRATDLAFKRLEARRSGYDLNTDTGEFTETEDSLAKKRRETQAFDPASEFSQGERERARGLLKGTRYAGLINDTMTGQQVKETLDDVNPFLNRESSERQAQARLNKEFSNSNKVEFSRLPKENQVEIEKLASKTGDKRGISNQLKADLTKLEDPSLNDEQKLVYARQMIKTLNSQQGQDAVGAEEAKRLSSLLEYHWFNLTNPGPVVGRAPISDFTNQVRNTVEGIDKSVELNNKEIDRLYGRQSGQVAAPVGPSPDQVTAYARRYNLDPATAEAILTQRMGGGANAVAGR